MKEAGLTRAGIYLRESKDKAGDAHNVADQLAVCKPYATDRGWHVVDVFTDNDLSAYSGKRRPAFESMMKLADAGGIDVIIVRHMDRLVRRLAELEDVITRCEKAGVRIVTLAGSLDLSTPSGRLNGRLLASVAQHEVEQKAERQVSANEQAAKRGQRRKGTPRPFGYQDDHVTPDPAEAAAVESACRMLLGGGTVSGIAREWARLGLRPPQAPYGPLPRNPWNRESVRAILTNPAIAGLSVYKGEVVGSGDWQPIVSEDMWRAVCGILNDPARKPPRGVRTLLGGLARCKCGNVISGSPTTLGAPGYRCQPSTRTDKTVTHVQTVAAPVDEFVETAVLEILSKPDALALFAVPGSDVDVTGLQARKLAIRTRLDHLAADYAEGLIERSALLTATERGRAEIAAIDAELAEAGRGNVLDGLAGEGDVRAAWKALDSSRKRAVIDAMMTVTLAPVGRGRRALKVGDFVTLTPRF